MIYHCCGDCGERWLIGNPRTCKCPEEKPQRTWVGLTDDEINLLAKAYSTMEGELNAPAFARAILRKAGEK